MTRDDLRQLAEQYAEKVMVIEQAEVRAAFRSELAKEYEAFARVVLTALAEEIEQQAQRKDEVIQELIQEQSDGAAGYWAEVGSRDTLLFTVASLRQLTQEPQP